MKQRQRIGSREYGSAALIAVLAAAALLATSGCTLITDIDRGRINPTNAQGGADAGNTSGSGGDVSNGGSSAGTGGTANDGGSTGGTANDASVPEPVGDSGPLMDATPIVGPGAGGAGASVADSGADAG